METGPESGVTESGLRWLKGLVIVLTGTMILGLVILVAMVVMTFLDRRAGGPVLPEALVLPEGERAAAYTSGTGWGAVVTRDEAGVERIHVVDGRTGEIRETLVIE